MKERALTGWNVEALHYYHCAEDIGQVKRGEGIGTYIYKDYSCDRMQAL